MSSILVLRQRDSVHLMADAAAYRPDGVLVSNNMTKCIAMPTLSAAVSCVGPAENTALFAAHLTQFFSSFDDVVQRGERCLPEIFDEISADRRGGDAVTSLYMIGWLRGEDRPAAYCIEMWTNQCSQMAELLVSSPNAERAMAQRSKLIEQTGFAGTPIPSRHLIDAAGFKLQDDDNAYDPDIDLLHMMEIQRHEEIGGAYWVGGAALLTSIDRFRITQRVVHRWAEDEIGKRIIPLPIDWKSWRADRARPAPASLVGLSRLERDILERKARKQARNTGAR